MVYLLESVFKGHQVAVKSYNHIAGGILVLYMFALTHL
jgi:hypothetical protein